MGILDFVFPKSCLGCGKEGKYICESCISNVSPAKSICPHCERLSIDGVTHIKCAKKLGLDGLISVWEYAGVIRKAILALKYKYATEVGRELSEVFLRYLYDSRFMIPDSAALVPVPLYWYRQNTRGFNQSIEMGRVLATEMGWKFTPELLVKKKSTQSQTELSGDARRQNLKGVFALNSNYLVPNAQRLVIFDDVFTTGSTLREAAKVLKRAGAKKVWGLTIAR